MRVDVAPKAAVLFPALKANKLIELNVKGLVFGSDPLGVASTLGRFDRDYAMGQCSINWQPCQVGLLEGFEDSDPVIQNTNGAKHLASKLSQRETKGFYEVAYGVWDVESGFLMSIFYCGQEYT